MKVFEWFEAKMDSLGDRIGSPFQSIAEWFEAEFQNKITEALISFFERFEHELKEPLQPFINEILENKDIPLDIRTMLEEVREPKHFASSAVIAVAAGMSIIPALSALISGKIQKLTQTSLNKFKPTLLGIDELIGARWRGNIGPDYLYEELGKHGYSDDKKVLIEAIRRYVPNAQDLIRFSVRDVFRKDIVEKYGYDTDFDKMVEDIRPWIRSVGMDEDILKLYWRAHWALPSIGQAFEMLHRGEIEVEDVRLLLKTADVAPAWIDPIIKVAYAPYTRVDVRRMYDAGVIDKEAVTRAYLDIGYDQEHADNLTTWTVAESMSSEKDLSKSEILTAYAQGGLTLSDAESSLIDMGYDQDEAGLILAIQDYKIDNRIREREKDILIKYFIRGDIEIEMLKDSFSKMGLSERESAIAIEEARSKVREKVATPTKADLIKWLDKGIISKEAFVNDMYLKGYSHEHIQNYIAAAG